MGFNLAFKGLTRIFTCGFNCSIFSSLQKIGWVKKIAYQVADTYPTSRSWVLFSPGGYSLLFLVFHMVAFKRVPHPGFVFISFRAGAAPPPILL